MKQILFSDFVRFIFGGFRPRNENQRMHVNKMGGEALDEAASSPPILCLILYVMVVDGWRGGGVPARHGLSFASDDKIAGACGLRGSDGAAELFIGWCRRWRAVAGACLAEAVWFVSRDVLAEREPS